MQEEFDSSEENNVEDELYEHYKFIVDFGQEVVRIERVDPMKRTGVPPLKRQGYAL